MSESNANSASHSFAPNYLVYKAVRDPISGQYSRNRVMADRELAAAYLIEFVRYATAMQSHVDAQQNSELLRAIKMIVEGADGVQPLLSAEQVAKSGSVDPLLPPEDIIEPLIRTVERLFFFVHNWSDTNPEDALQAWTVFMNGSTFWETYGRSSLSPERSAVTTSDQ